MRTHERISTGMVGHLKLTADNIARSTWLSARMLHKDPKIAQIGAREFQNHLVRLRPQNATPYDQAWLGNDRLMSELGLFCVRHDPCVLWHGRGRYSTCFMFLACRFLNCEDSVMSAEGVHARWKWVCHVRRRISLPVLNAILKLTVYLEIYGCFSAPRGVATSF